MIMSKTRTIALLIGLSILIPSLAFADYETCQNEAASNRDRCLSAAKSRLKACVIIEGRKCELLCDSVTDDYRYALCVDNCVQRGLSRCDEQYSADAFACWSDYSHDISSCRDRFLKK